MLSDHVYSSHESIAYHNEALRSANRPFQALEDGIFLIILAICTQFTCNIGSPTLYLIGIAILLVDNLCLYMHTSAMMLQENEELSNPLSFPFLFLLFLFLRATLPSGYPLYWSKTRRLRMSRSLTYKDVAICRRATRQSKAREQKC